VVYLNGQEVWRINMPVAPAVISFNTYANSSVSGTGENTWYQFTLPTSGLVPGVNIIAVEVHQSDASSSDVSFDFELQGTINGATEIAGITPQLNVTLDANPITLRAIFESDGTCGILPDTVSQNLTLTAACSPYIAAGDVTVKPMSRSRLNPE
jgi:hypothetical protein